jgi:O-antigen/teichoic acid export membrane protein
MESALGVYALVSLLTSGVTWFFLARHGLVRRAPIERRYIGELLRQSSAIVFGNVNGAMLTNGGIALLGMHADPATVGAANLALRVRMAGQAVMLPVQQLGFVRISGLASRTPLAAMALGSRLMVVTLAIGTVISLVCMVAAPWIAAYVFKGDVPVAVLLILLLSFSIPVQGMANLFGMQSLIALGQERRYALIQLAATLSFCACLFLLDRQSAYGWAILGAEMTVMLLSAGVLIRLRGEMAA